MIDEDAPAGVGQEERDVLVGLLGAGAAVAVPHLDRLPVLHKRGEALAEAVDVFANGKVEALEEMRCLAAALDGVAGILGAAAGQANAVAQEVEAVASLARQNRRQRPAAQGDGRFRLLDTPMPLRAVDLEFGALGERAPEMLDANADHPFGRREEAQGEKRHVELVAARAQLARRNMRDEFPPLHQHRVHMHRVEQRQVLRDQPVAIDEFHGQRALSS